jgi:nucleoside 2-deoxyribosyltransferase
MTPRTHRIYIAASSSDLYRARQVARRLTEQGHIITSHWWELIQGAQEEGIEPNHPTDPRRSLWARGCLAEIEWADALALLLPSTPLRSEGALCEYGYAVALRKITWMVGDWRRTIFSEVATQTFEADEDLIRYLGVLR